MKFYEPGMRILFDAGKKEVTVTFRGRRTTLPGQYETDDQARHAGENYCRSQGWKDFVSAAPMPPKSLLAHRKGARALF
jgi:hypothetical protein